MLDDRWHVGLDGNWNSARELADWPRLAAEAAEELRRLQPNQSQVVNCGPLGLPVLIRLKGSTQVAYIMVHSFWRLDEMALTAGPLADTLAAVPGKRAHFVDTFDVARRPVKALENAQTRDPHFP